MSKIVYMVFFASEMSCMITDLAQKGIVSLYQEGDRIIVARKGTNKCTMRRILRKEIGIT